MGMWPLRLNDLILFPGMSLQWQGDWLVLSGGLGVVVRLDRSSSISISVDHEFWGQTQGLCGLYNGRPEDDFVEPGGGLAMLASTFGNSWKLPGSEVRQSPACLLFSRGLHGEHTGSGPHRESGNCYGMTILGPPCCSH